MSGSNSIESDVLDHFADSVSCGDCDVVGEMLQTYPQLLHCADDTWSENIKHKYWLRLAIMSDRMHMLEFLLEQGMDVDERDHIQETPLSFAVTHSVNKAVPILLRHGANKDVSRNGVRPIHHAACGDHRNPMLKALIEHGAKMEIPGEPTNALVLAADWPAVNNVRTLLQAGMDPRPALELVTRPESRPSREILELWAHAHYASDAIRSAQQSAGSGVLRSL